jgi:hypothetical protein
VRTPVAASASCQPQGRIRDQVNVDSRFANTADLPELSLLDPTHLSTSPGLFRSHRAER